MYLETDLPNHNENKNKVHRQLELELQIQHLEGLKILAGGISHDLNNLLMTIIGNVDMIIKNTAEESQISINLGRIKEAVVNASELINQVLSYIGKENTIFEPIYLKRTIIETEKMLRLPSEKRAILQFDLDDVPAMNADVSQIFQLIMNMIINASEVSCLNHCTIEISLKCHHMTREELDVLYEKAGNPEGEYIHLKVLNKGCDLNKDYFLNIFGPFYHTEYSGKGFGMAAALELVKNHQGVIRVSFEKGGEESTTAIFPSIDSTHERFNSAEPVRAKGMSKKTVLLVDDDLLVLTTAGDMLKVMGHSVITASNGFEAIKMFKSAIKEIDCVLLDLTMPNMNGIQTFSILRMLKSDVPVILSSGYNQAEVSSDYKSIGYNGFLKKPYDLVMLQDVLESVLKIDS